MVSPYTYHVSGRGGHRNVFLLRASRVDSEGWLAGASLFRNSFGLPSAYAFVGHEYVERNLSFEVATLGFAALMFNLHFKVK